jgi:hypothetical protein
MALFPLGFVLRVFPPAAYSHVRLGENPCAALTREKISHFWTGNLIAFKGENSDLRLGLWVSVCLPREIPARDSRAYFTGAAYSRYASAQSFDFPRSKSGIFDLILRKIARF